MEDVIHCPRCGSTQITANKKGFSGGKALVGGLATGGVGLLAGTIGKNKIQITCLACGKVFAPGEGKIEKPPVTNASSEEPLNDVDQKILSAYRDRSTLIAVKICKDSLGLGLQEAHDYVEKLASKNNIKRAAGGCMVAILLFLISTATLFGLVIKLYS